MTRNTLSPESLKLHLSEKAYYCKVAQQITGADKPPEYDKALEIVAKAIKENGISIKQSANADCYGTA